MCSIVGMMIVSRQVVTVGDLVLFQPWCSTSGLTRTLSVWQYHMILYLDVTEFITRLRGNFVCFNPVSNRTKHQTDRTLQVLQIDSDTSECDHSKGRHKIIVDQDIVEGLLTRLEWEHLDLNKTKSPTGT